jgi:Ser/Thr protein kinase RdoA (MazF antagonist)
MPVFQDVLAQYLPEFQPTHVEPLGSAGGMSGAQFWRVTAVMRGSTTVVRGSPDPAPPRALILRRWPAEHPSQDRLRFIHAVLRHAAERGCGFLPVPATSQAGQSFVSHAGHLWELAPGMPGAADFDRSPSVDKLRAAMRALAQFHNAVADFPLTAMQRIAGAPPAPVRHVARLRALTPSQIQNLAHSIRDTTWPDLAPLARRFIETLPQTLPRAIAQVEPLTDAHLPLQPCLRDIWHDHVLFTGDEVTGLVDFGATDIDTPATDLGRLLGSLASSSSLPPLPCREACGEPSRAGQGEGSPSVANTWQEGFAAYNTLRPLTPDEARAAHALNTSGNLLAGCNWIRWIYIEDRQFDDPAQVIERFRRIVARCGHSGGS